MSEIPPKTVPGQNPQSAEPRQAAPPQGTPRRAIVGAQITSEFAGPLPPPPLLEHYERICPGTASKMFELARIEGEHRRSMESQSLQASIEAMRRQFSEARLGQVFAFIIALTFMIGGAYVIIRGYAWPGTVLSGVGLGGIVTSFIVGRGKRDNSSGAGAGDSDSQKSASGKSSHGHSKASA